MDKSALLWKDPILGNWTQNIFFNDDLQINRSQLAFQELINGIAVSRTSKIHFENDISKAFHRSDTINEIGNLKYSGFYGLDTATASLQKSCRLISSYLDSKHEYYKVDYDFSAPSMAEEPERSEIITPQLLITETRRIKKVILEIYKNNLNLFRVTPREFEELIAELLEQKGYSTELTKQTRDGGYDLIALKDDNGFALKYLVECKKHRKDRTVGIGIVRSFSDVVRTENANRGIIFTTSYFSPEARKRQKTNPYLLDLRDHDDVIKWVKDYIVGI